MAASNAEDSIGRICWVHKVSESASLSGTCRAGHGKRGVVEPRCMMFADPGRGPGNPGMGMVAQLGPKNMNVFVSL